MDDHPAGQGQLVTMAAPEARVITDELGIVSEGNDEASELLGIAREALPGKPLVTYVVREDMQTFLGQLHIASTQRPPTLRRTFVLRPRHRTPFHVIADVEAHEHDDGAATLHWRLVDAVRAQRLAQAGRGRDPWRLESVPALLWMADTDLRITALAGGLRALALHASTGSTVAELFETDPTGRFISSCRAALVEGRLEAEVEWRGRTLRAYIDSTRTDGRVDGIAGVAVDVTSTREVEVRLRHSLERDAYARDRLQEIGGDGRAFFRALDHDLVNQLAVVLGYTELLSKNNALRYSPATRTLIQPLADGARDLQRWVRAVIDFFRLSYGEGFDPVSTNVGAVVAKSLGDLRKKGNVVIEASDVWVTVDPSAFERIVANLVWDSLKHTPGDAPVHVTVSPEDDGVLVTVAGAGGAPVARGSGVELSLAERFVEAHHGRAWVEESGAGNATFKFWLPGLAHGLTEV